MRNRKFVLKTMCIALAWVFWAAAPIFLGTQVALAENVVSAVQHQLKDKQFKGVTVSAQDGTVTLTGKVDRYAYKVQAEKKAKSASGVKSVKNEITVGGPTIADDVLQKKLLERIQVDRVGMGQVFSAIGVHVHDGVATLYGHAVDPPTADSAVGLVENTPGVKGVVNEIKIDPVSQMDNSIRRNAFRAIYDYPPLRRYAQIRTRPIRISVQNGHLTLYGAVGSEMDKQMAGMRAKQVPNVFSVTNDLVVAP